MTTKNNLLARTSFGANSLALIAPEESDRAVACLEALQNHPQADKIAEAQYAQDEQFWPPAGSWMASLRPYVVKQGILQIPVRGVLLHNFSYSIGDFATGYFYIQKALERGLADPEVKGIALVCHSPGGHVAGCFELADRIYKAREKKPIQAFAHEAAFSAAYAIASAADKITVSRTGGVGSIGVVTMHVDFSQQLEAMGVKVTFIYAGKHKVDGNAYEPLSDGAKARIQKRIDDTYSIFVQSVARNRPIGEKEVRDTEALTYGAEEALDVKLADAIGPFDEAISAFTQSLATTDGEDEMTEEEMKAAIAAAEQKAETAIAAATAEGATAERTRISAIMALDEAKDRPAAAQAAALDTEMSVEKVQAFLAKLPVESASTETVETKESNSGDNRFSDAMDKSGEGPGAGAGGKQADEMSEREKEDAAAERILTAKYGERQTA